MHYADHFENSVDPDHPIVHFMGSQVACSKSWYISVPEGCFSL